MNEPLDAETIELLDAMGLMMVIDGDALTVRFRDTPFVQHWIAADGLTPSQLVGREVMTLDDRTFVLIEGTPS